MDGETLIGNNKRRDFVRAAAGAGLMAAASTAVRAAQWVGGSDAPEKREIKVGYIPLTDCAPVVMAPVNGFDKQYGIRIVPSREPSWAVVRDKLMSGELDAAHVLYGLVYGVQLGIGGPQVDMNVLMALSANGQAITLSNQLREEGIVDGASLARQVAQEKRKYTFAQTFPTGTHALWLNYWLAAHGIDPLKAVRTITVPPRQMVANMRAGNMDGFCVGEPWNILAVNERIGFTVATSQDLWPDHPEKVIGTTATFVQQHPNAARALTAALLESCRWLDATDSNRKAAARVLAGEDVANTDAGIIEARLLGNYDNGLGQRWNDPKRVSFFADGAVNFPYRSDAMWFMTQHKRWGMLKQHPDYLTVASAVNRVDIYVQAATAAGVALPAGDMRTVKLMDGIEWNGLAPAQYAGGFAIQA